MKTEFFEGLIATSDRIPKNLAFLEEIKALKVVRQVLFSKRMQA